MAGRTDGARSWLSHGTGLTSILAGILFFTLLHNPVQAVQSVTLAWDKSPDLNVVGYNIYYGVASGTYTNHVDAGNATNRTIPGLVEGRTYFFAATAYNTTDLESVFSNETGYTVPLSNNLPTITLTSPANGTSYTTPATFSLTASVTANGHTITKVHFYNGATLLGEDASSPYSYTWSGVSAGSYSLTARVAYDAGSTLNSTAANVIVTSQSPPTIALTSPLSGSTYSAPATISLAASVTANGHTITIVQFYNGTTLLGEDTSAPYAFTLSNASAGNFNLTARVIYDTSSTLSSSTVNVSVTNPPPTVALASPVSGTSYTAPANISLAASVTTNGHTITKVQFYNSATLLGEASSSPYAFSWSNVSAGNFSLTARAVYDAGSTVDSSPVTVGVNATGLPAPWQTADIGSVSAAGSASLSNGTYTVKGAGNLGGRADNFRFVYQALTGDGEIKVRLNAVENTGTSGRIGVIIRESLTSGSRYAYMGISPDGTFQWQRRSSTGGSTSSTTSTVGSLPNVWVRLVRTGKTLYGYRSTNGTTWTLVNSRSITMATSTYVGLAVASGSSATLNTATFSSATVVP